MLEQLLSRIANRLCTPLDSINSGLSSGEMGEIIFLYEYSKIESNYLQLVERKLEHCLDQLHEGRVFPTYCTGLAGICLGISYLYERGFLEETIDIADEIDIYLENFLKECFSQNNYDFLHGTVGVGFYFIERYKVKKEISKNVLKMILHYLHDSAGINDDIIKWSVLRNERIIYDLSMAHGMAGIVAFLAKVPIIMDKNEQLIVEKLIGGSVNFILSQQIDCHIYNSYFPYSVNENATEFKGSRLAWCYGDLRIGVALLNASEVFGNKMWRDKALEVIKYSATRMDLRQNLVFDACICHGTAGIAAIFYGLYTKTKDTSLFQAAKYWIGRTLDFCNVQEEAEFFKLFYKTNTNTWESNNRGILEGLAGVGLALLFFSQKETPHWDRFILLR